MDCLWNDSALQLATLLVRCRPQCQTSHAAFDLQSSALHNVGVAHLGVPRVNLEMLHIVGLACVSGIK